MQAANLNRHNTIITDYSIHHSHNREKGAVATPLFITPLIYCVKLCALRVLVRKRTPSLQVLLLIEQ